MIEVPMRRLWLLAVLPLLLVACDSGEDDTTPTTTATTTTPAVTATATAEPSATATPIAAELCPISGDSCSFINQVARHVLEGNGSGVISNSRATFYECPGPAGGLGEPFPLCEGAEPGEYRAGFPSLHYQSEGSIIDEATARDM